MPDEEDGVQWYIYDTVLFLLHSHFAGGLPIFSPADFETIAVINDVGFLKPGKFFFGVATETGSYVLTIEDIDKFEIFIEKYIDIGRKSKRLEAKYNDYKIGKFSDNNKNIIEFLNLMNDLDMGMSLLKANDDFSNFSKVSVVNDTLNFQVCH